MSSTLHVPRDAFEHFQAALRRESRLFITDCANFLGLPPGQLIKEVQDKLKAQSVSVSLFESESSPGCLAYLKQDNFAPRCRLPCLTNSTFCHKHQTTRIITDDTKATKKYIRLKGQPNLPEMWLDDATNEVIDIHGRCVGTYDRDSQLLKLYVIDAI
jgi:hypothetical protein